MPEKTILLTLKVPQSFKKKIDKQVKEGGYGTMANYIRSLVRKSFDDETGGGAQPPENCNAISMISWKEGGTDLRFCMVNESYARMHGYKIPEMVGKPLGLVYPKNSHESLKSHLDSIAKKGHYTFASEHVRKDGTAFKVIVDVRTVVDNEGNSRFCLATVSPMNLDCCEKK
jgi:PAS domain S-box-containing protein